MPVDIEIVEDLSAQTPSDKGYLKVRRLKLRTRNADGTLSEVYRYDAVDRAALDAVVVVMWSERPGAPRDPLVCVRQQLRPPLVLRRERELVVPDARTGLELWELPAGLIEADERGEEGVLECARRETEEETGFSLPRADFARLGVAVYLSPGMCAEKIHVVKVRVPDPTIAVEAKGDGVVEAGSTVAWWPLSECLARAEDGTIEDAKTELALRRLRAELQPGA
ncbi:MAG: ADP-ribose pyrophosphatase [Myxococcaceae bacterium]|nr:ADP-ribose pyrophosphatase [Myxococcaceae bacterium]